jgi:hypothetical protein
LYLVVDPHVIDGELETAMTDDLVGGGASEPLWIRFAGGKKERKQCNREGDSRVTLILDVVWNVGP